MALFPGHPDPPPDFNAVPQENPVEDTYVSRPTYSTALPANPTSRVIRCRMGYSRGSQIVGEGGAIADQTFIYRDPILQYYRSRQLKPSDDLAVSRDGDIQDHHHLHLGILDDDAGLERGVVNTPRTTNVVWSYAGYTRTTPGGVITPNLLRNVPLDSRIPPAEIRVESLISNWVDSLGTGVQYAESSPNQINFDFGVEYRDVGNVATQGYAENYQLQFPPPPYSSQYGNQPLTSWVASQALVDVAMRSFPRRLSEERESEILAGIPFNSLRVREQIQVGTGLSVAQFRQQYPAINTNARDVQGVIDDGFPATKDLAALTAYPDNIFDEISLDTFVDFPYLEFDHETAFTEDVFTANMNLFNQSVNPQALDPASSKGHYNFLLKTYEKGIISQAVPETVLPNYYVYNILSQGEPQIADRPEWQAGARAAQELQGNYDTLISPSEVFSGILPRIGDEEFLQYLSAYIAAVQGGVTVDYLNQMATLYSNQAFAAAEMDIFDYLNRHKYSFPFFTEISFPTNPITPVGELLQQYHFSNQVSNVISTQFPSEPTESSIPFRLESSYIDIGSSLDNAYSIPGDEDGQEAELDPFILDEITSQPQVKTGLFLNRILNQMSFDNFYQALFEEIDQMLVITRTGADASPGACNEQMKRLILTEMQQMVEDKAFTSMKTYEDVLNGNDICDSEVLLYKLIKTRQGQEEPLQTYYFPNSNLTDVIKFVDTQVKPDVSYNYELMAYAVVYGTTFRFRTRSYNGQVDPTGIPTPNADDRVFFSFAVQNLPLVQVVEYPVISSAWQSEPTMGGVVYPPATCRDYPPVPPLVFPQPYQNNHREVLFMFQPQSGDLTGHRAVPYIPFNDTEVAEMEELSREQKIEKNFFLKRGYLEFRNDGADDIEQIQIYRSDADPTAVSYSDGAYTMFGDEVYKTLNISCDDEIPLENRARAFDFTDIIQSNRCYYYTFRSVDRKGQISNPTAIYKVELYFENGLYIPYISIYQPEVISDSVKSKRFARFIEIRAADLQVEPYIRHSSEEGGIPVAAEKNLIMAKGDQVNHVSYNTFLVRITSKDTGKRLDIRVNLPESAPNPTEGQLCDEEVDSQRNGGPALPPGFGGDGNPPV